MTSPPRLQWCKAACTSKVGLKSHGPGTGQPPLSTGRGRLAKGMSAAVTAATTVGASPNVVRAVAWTVPSGSRRSRRSRVQPAASAVILMAASACPGADGAGRRLAVSGSFAGRRFPASGGATRLSGASGRTRPRMSSQLPAMSAVRANSVWSFGVPGRSATVARPVRRRPGARESMSVSVSTAPAGS